MSLVDLVWERYGKLTLDEIPEDARRVGRQGLLDWFGCALAGGVEPLARIMRDELLDDASGSASVFGTNRGAPPQTAALLNGAAGHALDYDDTNTVGGFHPSVPVVPAALALAEIQDRSGADLLTAYIVGIEAGSRFGAAIGPEHYAKGWHTTSSIGVFGATAASAWLLGLDGDRFRTALGLAASLSSGVQANFATMTKPLHAGHAAERGLLAARLAGRGYTANPDAFESVAGLLEAAATGQVNTGRLDAIDDVWVITRSLFKYRAACHGTHSAIESALQLMADVALEDVTRVEVRVHPNIFRVCKVIYPRSGLEAKFSLRAATALAMLGDDTADPTTFNDVRVLEPDLVDLTHRIDVVEDGDHVSPTGAIVRFDTATGSREAAVDIGTPDTDLDRQEQRLLTKFGALAGRVVGVERAKTLADSILDVAAVQSVRELTS
jgi:2-methylcitrate dehydratase PrpD